MGSALSVAASLTILRGTINEIIPEELRHYFTSLARRYSSEHTLVVNDSHEDSTNHLYEAVATYLGGGPLSCAASLAPQRMTVGKNENLRTLTFGLDRGSEIVDTFHGVPMKWKFNCDESVGIQDHSELSSWYEVRFHKKHMKMVKGQYLPYILDTAKTMKDRNRVVKIHNVRHERWSSKPVTLNHPMTFDTLAMDEDEKRNLIQDLDWFVNGKDYFRRIGKVWKRGYLLYGPPGTGKSSLIAAMANYLNYDIYNLNLSTVRTDSVLETLLLHVANRSILVVEDIDCSIKLQNRKEGEEPSSLPGMPQLTLSGILNAVDGLLSCCGDERIIVFTTNYKEKLDPALLRPGRMDKHICLSYCSFSAFKQLALNYLGTPKHSLFRDIEKLLERVEVSPAEVAGELMNSKDPKTSLEGLIRFLEKRANEPSQNQKDHLVQGQGDVNVSQLIEETKMTEHEGHKTDICSVQKMAEMSEEKLAELKALSEKLVEVLQALK